MILRLDVRGGSRAHKSIRESATVIHTRRPLLLYENKKTGTLYPQLWVSIVEKGYAKLHGSYFSISGGFVEEAMLDLTGAPVHTIDFTHSLFNMQVFWRQLQHYRRMQFPMGCGTLFVFSS